MPTTRKKVFRPIRYPNVPAKTKLLKLMCALLQKLFRQKTVTPNLIKNKSESKIKVLFIVTNQLPDNPDNLKLKSTLKYPKNYRK